MPTPKYTKILEVESGDITAPSLSPNGRWIAYGGATNGIEGHPIWIVPASGGTPRRLTTGDYVDRAPVWFPAGDRIVFVSSRVGGALMTLRIDPATGQPVDEPRRLTLEVSGVHYAVSPDGKWVVYNSGTNASPGPLRIVPSLGGTARTIDSVPPGHGGFVSPSFTADGRYVEYIHGENQGGVVRRAPLSGGRPVDLLRGSANGLMRYANGVIADVRRGQDTVWLRNLSGDTLALFALEGVRSLNPWQGVRYTPRHDVMLVATIIGNSEVRTVSTEGGAWRAARGGKVQDYIESFLADGRLAVSVEAGGRAAIDLIPPSGGTPQRITLPTGARLEHLSSDGKIAYWRNQATFGSYDVAAGASRVLSRSYVRGATDYASHATTGDEDGFAERAGDRTDMRAWSRAKNAARLLRSFSTPGQTLHEFTFRGDVVAYTVLFGDSIAVFVAPNATAPAQRVAATRGHHSDGLSISRDGQHLAFAMQMQSRDDSGHVIGFVDLSTGGVATGQARLVPVFNVTGVAWLPNGKEIVYLDISQTGRTSMMRLVDEPGAMPRSFSQSERGYFYDFVLSPDGKSVAYPTPTAATGAIWRVELPGLHVGRSTGRN
jgi:Tol biopolymer transport system component